MVSVPVVLVPTVAVAPDRECVRPHTWRPVNRARCTRRSTHCQVIVHVLAKRDDPVIQPADAIHVLKMKDVVSALEAAADAFESVANTVEGIAVKES